MTADITIDCGHLFDRTSANALTLDGGGHTLTQACANNRVMTGGGAGALTLQNITVTGGDVDGFGGGVLWEVGVVVQSSTITGNSATEEGGGLLAGGH